MATKNGTNRVAQLAAESIAAAERERLTELLNAQDEAEAEVQLYVMQLRKQYRLHKGDQIDTKTGTITRA